MTTNNINIPADWQMKFLGDIGTFSKGAGITKNDLVDIGKPCVRYAELYTKFEFVIPKCISFIPEDIAKKSKQIQKGCILFAGSGETKEEIGKCAVYDNDEIAYAGGDNIIYTIKDNYPVYLSYYLNTLGRRQLNKLGQGYSIVHIHAEDLKKVKIPRPPLLEQEKIAEILSCWDEAIEKLSDLIELKKLLKKGLMQKLLTGKTRLLGFTQPWKEVKLGDVCSICTGKKDVNEGNPCGIYPFFTCARNNTFSDNFSFDKEAILIAGNGEVGNCQYYNGKFEAYQRTYVLSDFKVNGLLLFQYLDYFFKQYVDNQKQQGAMPYIKLGTLTSFPIYISNDSQEQNKILNILLDADSEIKFLKKKLELLQKQKKGLMQQLLTGKIRVKVDK